ncbi:MAG: cobalamin biosynthesis protein P47K [Clostridiales bacterium]|jgi:Ni2+-binding GTPase involved in maturation of urease and hydrogenase|nr:cobalamin biosynthesis protein P47K [Clostridiales bacterium]
MAVNKVVMLSGGAAVGKTAVFRHIIAAMKTRGIKAAVCKIDCLMTTDGEVYGGLGVPAVVGLSGDICPDHYLVSNLEELINWAGAAGAELLLIETAGLCHRCSPATARCISVCAVDCTSGVAAPRKLGPMLTCADIVLLTKIDMVSQAEREILAYNIREINRTGEIIPIDGVSGYGAELFLERIGARERTDGFIDDTLRHTMPGGVCSYCVGERRIGSKYQQGIVEKISFEDTI